MGMVVTESEGEKALDVCDSIVGCLELISCS